MKTSLVSWIVPRETGCCKSIPTPHPHPHPPPEHFSHPPPAYNAPFEPLKEASLIHLTRVSASELWILANAGVIFMLGSTKISDTRQTGPRYLYYSPSFLSKNQLAKERPEYVVQVAIPALAPTLDQSLKTDRSLEPYTTIWIGPQTTGRAGCCLLQ